MGLGPRIDLRVSQSLVMTQQLQQAIKLLALSNLEIEAVIAEELAKNPLLEALPGEGGAGEGVDRPRRPRIRRRGGRPDRLGRVIAQARRTDDSPVDIDWRGGAGDRQLRRRRRRRPGGEEAFDFDRLEGGEAGLSEHLIASCTGSAGRSAGWPRRSSMSWRKPAISKRRCG